MAENLVNWFLTEYPDFFKLTDRVFVQESSSTGQVSIVQHKLSRKVRASKMTRRWRIEATMGNVEPRSSPEFGGILLPSNFNNANLDCGFGIEAATPSRSDMRKAKSGQPLTELANEYESSSDKDNKQTLSNLLLDSSASFEKSPAKRSTSPLLYQALARRFSILRSQKPGLSPLRDEIHSVSADDDKIAHQEPRGPYLNTNFLNQQFKFRERPTDRSEVSYLGIRIDSTEVKEPAANAHKEGAIGEKTAWEGSKRTGNAHATPVKGAVVDNNSLLPPVAILKHAHPYIPAPASGNVQPTRWTFYKPVLKLHNKEQLKVTDELDCIFQGILQRSLDLAHESVVSKTVQHHKRAKEADKVLDHPNKFLTTLADLLEAEGGGHFVNAGDIEPNRSKMSAASSSKMSTKISSLDLFVAAMHEIREAVADPSYNVTTARERLFRTKGVNFDSQLVERLRDLFIDIDKELHTPSSSFAAATTQEEKKKFLLETMALVESEAFGKSQSNGKPAMEDPAADKLKDNESEVRAGGSTTGQGEGQANGTGKSKSNKSTPALDNVVNGKKADMEHHTLVESPAINKGTEKQSEPPMVGPKRRPRRGKKKKKNIHTEDVVTGENRSEEHDVHVEGSILDKGKGKESELPIGVPATEERKGKEVEMPQREETVVVEETKYQVTEAWHDSRDLLLEAKALVLGPEADPILDNLTELKITIEPVDQASSAILNSPKVIKARQAALTGFKKIYVVMELYVRLQTASPSRLDLFCRFVEDPNFFCVMSVMIDELQWNRAIIEHPDNPMITTILQRTAHLRPKDGLHHPSGISIAPLERPQNPLLPPGPASATPVVTRPTKKQHRGKRRDISMLKHARMKAKPPLEENLNELDLREKTLVGEMETGLSRPFAEAFDELTIVGNSKRHLKEEARLKDAGGKTADRLAQRLKKIAEEDGVPPYLLPPYTLP